MRPPIAECPNHHCLAAADHAEDGTLTGFAVRLEVIGSPDPYLTTITLDEAASFDLLCDLCGVSYPCNVRTLRGAYDTGRVCTVEPREG